MCGCCPDLYAEDLDGFKGKMPKGQAARFVVDEKPV